MIEAPEEGWVVDGLGGCVDIVLGVFGRLEAGLERVEGVD